MALDMIGKIFSSGSRADIEKNFTWTGWVIQKTPPWALLSLCMPLREGIPPFGTVAPGSLARAVRPPLLAGSKFTSTLWNRQKKDMRGWSKSVTGWAENIL